MAASSEGWEAVNTTQVGGPSPLRPSLRRSSFLQQKRSAVGLRELGWHSVCFLPILSAWAMAGLLIHCQAMQVYLELSTIAFNSASLITHGSGRKIRIMVLLNISECWEKTIICLFYLCNFFDHTFFHLAFYIANHHEYNSRKVFVRYKCKININIYADWVVLLIYRFESVNMHISCATSCAKGKAAIFNLKHRSSIYFWTCHSTGNNGLIVKLQRKVLTLFILMVFVVLAVKINALSNIRFYKWRVAQCMTRK